MTSFYPTHRIRPQRLPLDGLVCRVLPEETMELFCLGRLPAASAEAVETHCLVCPECAAAVEEIQEFVDTLHATVRRRDTGSRAGR